MDRAAAERIATGDATFETEVPTTMSPDGKRLLAVTPQWDAPNGAGLTAGSSANERGGVPALKGSESNQ